MKRSEKNAASQPSIAAGALPLVLELQPAPEAVAVFSRLSHLPHCLYLDSARRDPALGRYSFVAADPYDFPVIPADGSPGLAALAERMAGLQTNAVAGLPPFQGGAAGLLGYELARSIERVAPACVDEFGVPAMAVGFFDVVVAFDHLENRAWIISQGFPETDVAARQERARMRLEQMRQWIVAQGASSAVAETPARDPRAAASRA